VCSHSLLSYEQRLRQTTYTLIVSRCYLPPLLEAKNVDLLVGINGTPYTKGTTCGLPNGSFSGLWSDDGKANRTWAYPWGRSAVQIRYEKLGAMESRKD